MSTNASGTESGIDRRTKRAATESMVVVPDGDASGTFTVYSGTPGKYTVSLRDETCTCPDMEHHEPANGCKHQRRVRLTLGLLDLPAGVRPDPVLVADREKYGVDEKPMLIADGGAVSAPKPPESDAETAHADGCTDPECEGIDANIERPVLSFECWEQWAAYDAEHLIEEANQ